LLTRTRPRKRRDGRVNIGSAFVACFIRQFILQRRGKEEHASHPAFEQALERPKVDGPISIKTGKALRDELVLDRKDSRSI